MDTKKNKSENNNNSNFCVACGKEIPEGDMICKDCKEKAGL